MLRIIRYCCFLFGSLFVFFSPALAQPLVLGISEFASHNVNEPIIEATIHTLEQTLGKENLRVKRFNLGQLQQAVRKHELDLVLSSAGTFRRLVIEGAGLRDLATVASDLAPNPNYADGSVFFTLKDRQDLSSIADLKGKVVAANYPFAFSGWQIALGELHKRGYDPDAFFGKTQFLGHDAYPVVQAVLNKKADVGIVRACFLERSGLLRLHELKIIEPKTDRSDYPCRHSTDLYPNWTLATTPNTPPEISRKVAAALLAMPPLARNLHWSVATDFTGVDKLFLNLKIGPYEYLRKFDVYRFLKEYWPFIVIALLIFFGLLLHGVRANALVTKRTKQLRDSLARERALAKEAGNIRGKLDHIKTTGVVGQMCTMIAHELKQPLATASNYSFTLRRRIENGELDPDLLNSALEKISGQIQKSSQIIDRVRSYAKGERTKNRINLDRITRFTIDDIRKSDSRASSIHLNEDGREFWVESNELEFQIVLLNLLNNALEATADVASPQITVRLSELPTEIELRISDNGPAIADEQWKSLQEHTQKTTKNKGLGLGLMIVQSIAEDSGGHLSFERGIPGGLTVIVQFPKA